MLTNILELFNVAWFIESKVPFSVDHIRQHHLEDNNTSFNPSNVCSLAFSGDFGNKRSRVKCKMLDIMGKMCVAYDAIEPKLVAIKPGL